MNVPTCPYRVCEKTAFRSTLDLSKAAKQIVVCTWYCEHPFHGLRLELGDARSDMEKQCAVCPLPRPGDEGDGTD